MLEKRKREIGENETNSREVNQLVRPLDPELRTALCECGDAACCEQLLIAHDDYARLREDPNLFVLRPGHEFAETEQVEAKHLEYWIVRKRPAFLPRSREKTGAEAKRRHKSLRNRSGSRSWMAAGHSVIFPDVPPPARLLRGSRVSFGPCS